ncbi:hypothetical protein PC111_g1113 [Phytophthora cactorum]|nr:hypothetical protein PC111_g1113 [Phytophthora cactorum]KAG2918168.1 hypothetical protein PC114_g6891 [Phytophthora cactorum]
MYEASALVLLSQKRRRALLQDDGEGGASEAIEEDIVAPISLPCVVDGDANVMSVSAQHCTGLNSDEDTSEDEEQENDDEDESGEANLWDGDWDIVALTDEEEDKERADLPESVCLTAARNKKTPLAMKYIG